MKPLGGESEGEDEITSKLLDIVLKGEGEGKDENKNVSEEDKVNIFIQEPWLLSYLSSGPMDQSSMSMDTNIQTKSTTFTNPYLTFHDIMALLSTCTGLACYRQKQIPPKERKIKERNRKVE